MSEKKSPEFRDDSQLEKSLVPEIPRSGYQTLIIIQRHGEYDNRWPEDFDNIKENEKSYGSLTEKGIAETKEKAEERLAVIMDQDADKTDFLILNSPTFWLDHESLGQRAKETAEIIRQVILENLESRGLSSKQLLNSFPKIRGDATRDDEKLSEGLMFQVPEFVDFMRKKYGQGSEFWQAFFADQDQAVRENLKAEGPTEIAQRIEKSIKVVARFAKIYQHRYPGRKLVVWMVTHGDGLTPYVQRVIKVPKDSFRSEFNEAIAISIDENGEAKTKINGVEYNL
jgi:hypothetical protein